MRKEGRKAGRQAGRQTDRPIGGKEELKSGLWQFQGWGRCCGGTKQLCWV